MATMAKNESNSTATKPRTNLNGGARMLNRLPKQIVFGEPTRSLVDGHPVYALAAVVDGQTYFVTWEHATRIDALDQIGRWAIETGTAWQLWYDQFQLIELDTIVMRKQ